MGGSEIFRQLVLLYAKVQPAGDDGDEIHQRLHRGPRWSPTRVNIMAGRPPMRTGEIDYIGAKVEVEVISYLSALFLKGELFCEELFSG